MINRLKALLYLIRNRKGTLEKLTVALIAYKYPKRLKFVEIGVFKETMRLYMNNNYG
ncbi:MAG: hypothetical protein Q8O30_05335 [Candidatus Omnitrophota bacterium]|nr:hypothetical protein [Candidatus Omnitrophota bacterium]